MTRWSSPRRPRAALWAARQSWTETIALPLGGVTLAALGIRAGAASLAGVAIAAGAISVAAAHSASVQAGLPGADAIPGRR